MKKKNNHDDGVDDEAQTVTAEWIMRILEISRSTLDRLLAGDPTFPKMLVLPGGPRRWRKVEILQWMEAKKQ
jgi:predicted DNA-binding transcriptional regulator AlpA